MTISIYDSASDCFKAIEKSIQPVQFIEAFCKLNTIYTTNN